MSPDTIEKEHRQKVKKVNGDRTKRDKNKKKDYKEL